MLVPPPQPRVVDPPSGASALVIAAHPDDIESWCGGTLARVVKAGVAVDYLLLTSGDNGSDDLSLSHAQIAEMREREQQQAAGCLGVRSVQFLRHPDGELEDARVLREQVVRCLRRLRPAIVFTHDPEHPYPPYTTHRDHRVAGRVALDCVYPLARDARSFPEHLTEGLEPHVVQHVWLFASAAPDSWVDIGEGFDQKIAARLAHASQTADPEALRASWRKRAACIGSSMGVPLAEAFVALRLDA